MCSFVYLLKKNTHTCSVVLSWFQANPEEFIPIFANNPRELKAFLEHMIEVDPLSPQGVYDTLLELRLHDWAHEKNPEVRQTQIQKFEIYCGY